MHAPLKEWLAELAAGSDSDFELDRATLMVSKCEYPDIDVERYRQRLDRMADAVMLRTRGESASSELADALGRHLFDELGFRGNRSDYYDPRNSFLSDVLDRKTGIPITLSVVYLEVARRIGLEANGVGFPGHFLVKYRAEGETIVLDPFDGGRVPRLEELNRRLKEVLGDEAPAVEDTPGLLKAATRREILTRLLRNLKNIYMGRGQDEKALNVADGIVLLDPESAPDLRDRGLLYRKSECWHSARTDLAHYLELMPMAEDAQAVREVLRELDDQAGYLH